MHGIRCTIYKIIHMRPKRAWIFERDVVPCRPGARQNGFAEKYAISLQPGDFDPIPFAAQARNRLAFDESHGL
jgi:hypothetical protein